MEKWWNESYIDKRTWLLDNYHHLEINGEQLLVLMTIDLFKNKNINFTFSDIAKHLKLTERKVNDLIEQLINKNYLNIKVNAKSINFNMDGVFSSQTSETKVPNTLFDLFEEQFKRPLNNKEMENLAQLIKTYSKDYIELALREAIIYNSLSLRYIEKILNSWKEKNLSIEDLKKGVRHE